MLLLADKKVLQRIGNTEKQQLLIYLANRDAIDKFSAKKFGHNVTVLSVECLNYVAYFKLRDHWNIGKNDVTSFYGGNSFRIIYRGSRHRYACPYNDSMDNNYIITCVMYDPCTFITIHLTYVYYGAYRWDGVFANDLVWSGNVCYKNHSAVNKFRDDTYKGWYRNTHTDNFRWINKNYKELLSQNQTRLCFNRTMPPIEFLGDSQLRYALNTIISIVSTDKTYLHNATKIKTNFSNQLFNFNFFGYTINPNSLPGFLSDPHGYLPKFKFPKSAALG